MNVKEIQREIEVVEKTANSNVDIKDIQGQIAKGVWEIALQLAQLMAVVQAVMEEERESRCAPNV